MSFSQAKYIQLSDKQGQVFRGGIVDNSEPNYISYSQTPFARNFRVNGRGISIRPGFTQFSNSFAATGTPKGIGAYLRADPTNDAIIVQFDVDGTHKLVAVNPVTGVQTNITTGANITTTTRMNFQSANDSMYCMNGVDKLGRLNGTTYTAIDTSSIFYGSINATPGLNDATPTYGDYGHIFSVYIDGNGSPNTFKWNVDNGPFTTGVAITGAAQSLAFGTSIKFAATTGHTIGDLFEITTGLKPSFSTWFDNAMFVSGDSSKPNRLFKSAENNPESYSGGGSDIFDQLFPVVGLASSGQTLYIFTESTIDMINNNSIKQIGSSLVYTSVPLEANEGASNHNSIVSVGKDCFFLTKSNKIRKVAPNSMLHYDVMDISHRANRGINSTMAKLDPDQTKSFAYVIPDKQLIKWHVKSIGATYNDICIVYNYEYDEFMVDTQKIFFGGVWYKGTPFTISHIEPKIYQDEYGQSDDDAAIQFEYWTKRIDLGDPTMIKELWQARTFLAINSSASVVQNIYIDGALIDTRTITKNDIPLDTTGIGTKAIGTFAIGTMTSPTTFSDFTNTTIGDTDMFNVSLVRDKGHLQVRGKYIYFQYTCGSLGGKCLLQNVEPRIQVLDQLTSSTSI